MSGWAGPFNSGTTAGGAGVSTNNATSTTILNGVVEAIYVKYNGSHPATTDVTVATAGVAAPAYNLLVLTNANTSGIFLPRLQIVNTAGTALTYDGTRTVNEMQPIGDRVKVTVAQSDDSLSVDVYLYLL